MTHKLRASGWPGGPLTKVGRITWLYAGLVSLWLLLRAVFFDCCWPLALLNYLGEYYFLPLPILALVVVLCQQWRSLIPLTVPAIAFGLMFGDFFLPRPSDFLPDRSQTPGTPILTAMSFNVLWSNQDYEAIATSVKAAAPDLIGFEELHPTNYDGIAARLEGDYPYQTPPPPDPSGGVGLFSRYPIVWAEPFPLPPRNLAVQALVDIEGQRVRVFVVHLSPNNMLGYPPEQFIPLASERNASRLAETAQLASLIGPLTEPVILMCDCNLTDTSQAYQTLSAFLIDSHREAGWGFGHTLLFPNIPFQVQRIDFVWHNPGFVALETAVGAEGGSDHLPSIAKLAFARP